MKDRIESGWISGRIRIAFGGFITSGGAQPEARLNNPGKALEGECIP
jgi:hypothetical protein